MKKTLIAVCVGAASQAMAQVPESRMEHVLVTMPIHKKAAETALPVTVLSGEELRRLASSTLGETLGNKPGISNASFGPGVGRPVIRGQGGPRTINLSNGIAAADVSSLSPDHAVGIEPMLADSVEVLRGPATLLYGGGAIGGVINTRDNRIPSQRIDGVQGAVEYRYDDAPEMDTGVVKLEAGAGDFASHVSGTFRDFENTSIPGLAIDEEGDFENSDGVIANSDGDSDVFTIGGSYHFGETDFLGLAYNSFETNYGIPPGDEGEIIRLDVEQERYDAQLHVHDLLPGLIDVARGFLTYTDYEHAELEGVEIGTQFFRETWEGRLELVREANNHRVLGLQWRADDFQALGDEAYVPETDSSEWGLFYVQDFHAADWHFELGGRADYVDRDPATGFSEDFTSISLSASGLYNISPGWNLGVALSRAERAPATEELFSNLNNVGEQLVTHAATGIIEIGDPDLGTEASLNADLSLTWTGERHFAELTMFYNTFNDYIFLLNTGDVVIETPVYVYEQEDADFYGVEFDSSFALASVGDGNVALGVFGDMITGEFDSAGDVPRLPPMRIGSELSWRSDSLGAYVRVLNASDQDNPGDFETETDGYTRWDAGIDYRVTFSQSTEMLAFLKLKNIGDEEIRLSTSFLRNFAPQAGESIEAGVRFMF